MVEDRSRTRRAAGLRIDAVEALPTDLDTVLVRVAGAWEGPPPLAPQAPVLVLTDASGEHRVGSLPQTSGAAERAALEVRPFRAAFSVPDRLAALLAGPLDLELGAARIHLPGATEPGGGKAGGTVVERAVLVERRARRAELAEAAARRRSEAAQTAVATMETELAELEVRLRGATEEREALESELEERRQELARVRRELVATRQEAHAERQLREEAIAEARQQVARAHAEAGRLGRARAQADRRAAELRSALASARREAAEARQHAETVTRAPRPDPAVVRAERWLVASGARVAHVAVVGATRAGGLDRAVLERERRMVRRASPAGAAMAEARALLARERGDRARAELALGERIRGLAREANELRTRADAERRAREAAEAEWRALARKRAELEAGLATALAQPAPASEPEPSPAARPAPAPAPRPERPWLAIGLQRLVAENEMAAARLALELLPGQALTRQALSYDVEVDTLGWHEVTLEHGRGRLTARRVPRADGSAAFRLTATPAALATLVLHGGSPRLRRRGLRISGTRRRRRALRSLPPVRLDLTVLAEAGVWMDPLLLHRALAASIDPAWTKGHAFCLEHTIEGPRGGRCFVTVNDGAAVKVRNRPPGPGVTRTVATSHGAFLRALGAAAAEGQAIEGKGDTATLALLAGWARWGSGADRPSAAPE